MTIRSYLVRFSTDIPITLNDEEMKDGDFFAQVMERSQEVLNLTDMNERKFKLAIIAHVNESED